MPGTEFSTFDMDYFIKSSNSRKGGVIYPRFTNVEIAQGYMDSHQVVLFIGDKILPHSLQNLKFHPLFKSCEPFISDTIF